MLGTFKLLFSYTVLRGKKFHVKVHCAFFQPIQSRAVLCTGKNYSKMQLFHYLQLCIVIST